MVNKAFVTGANRGIGFEIAKQLAEHGYFVIVGARRLESGQQAVNKLVEAGISAPSIGYDSNRLDRVTINY